MSTRPSSKFTNKPSRLVTFAAATSHRAVRAPGQCQAMRMGHSESEIAASAAQFNIQADHARYVLHGAEYHFCPSYY